MVVANEIPSRAILPSAEPVRHRKAAEVIAEQLRRSIVLDGRPGDSLPSEKALIEQFQVSRPTLREALRVLESDGLVEIRRGLRGGAVVREPTVDELAFRFGILLQMQGTMLEDLFVARIILEPAAAKLAAERVGAGASPASLETLLAAEEKAIDDVQADRTLSTALVDFHDGVLELAGSKTLFVLWKLLDEVVGPYTFASLVSFEGKEARLEAMRRSHASHQALLKAIQAGDSERAARIMHTHVAAIQRTTQPVASLRMVDMFSKNFDNGDSAC